MTEELKQVKNALEVARTTFNGYADYHDVKGDHVSTQKAEVNRRLAGEMKEAIAELNKFMESANCDRKFLYKQVERGLFDKHTTPEMALSNIAYSGSAPWDDDGFNWDVDHKEYAEEFYKKFPNAKV